MTASDLRPFAGIVLAGGKSSRMGTDKAALTLHGQTFLEIQVNKFKSLRAAQIMISGNPSPVPNTHQIRDLIPGCGPLGGLYSCFLQSREPRALVLGVDVPLISVRTLEGLLKAHQESGKAAVLLTHEGKWEPLIAVYSTDTADILKDLLDQGRYSVRSFLDRIPFRLLEYRGDPLELLNCNTPEDLKRLL